MTFDKILETVVNGAEGAVSAVMIGFDGITVAKHIKEKVDIDPESLAIEFTRVVPEIVRTAASLNLGSVGEITVACKNYFVIFMVLPENYFVALVLKDNASLGKGRYVLRKNAQDLISQL